MIEAITGRYMRLELEGQAHRLYFEEAGQGIPVLLQHTAGCHSSQWRHLFEIPEITDIGDMDKLIIYTNTKSNKYITRYFNEIRDLDENKLL